VGAVQNYVQAIFIKEIIKDDKNTDFSIEEECVVVLSAKCSQFTMHRSEQAADNRQTDRLIHSVDWQHIKPVTVNFDLVTSVSSVAQRNSLIYVTSMISPGRSTDQVESG